MLLIIKFMCLVSKLHKLFVKLTIVYSERCCRHSHRQASVIVCFDVQGRIHGSRLHNVAGFVDCRMLL